MPQAEVLCTTNRILIEVDGLAALSARVSLPQSVQRHPFVKHPRHQPITPAAVEEISNNFQTTLITCISASNEKISSPTNRRAVGLSGSLECRTNSSLALDAEEAATSFVGDRLDRSA
ncbi:hypothetical protein TSAR_016067 [Trichomalopsis sarcophagae]|uniref:Uncharacterized protein n=1 Tax=Trichomalopsis sarcophagae TaxID=543379 RepID=A0A232FBJ9_9HYME|nr:hypothetical protein TSAR_016067 [Trichomalopsis sarcophagae]